MAKPLKRKQEPQKAKKARDGKTRSVDPGQQDLPGPHRNAEPDLATPPSAAQLPPASSAGLPHAEPDTGPTVLDRLWARIEGRRTATPAASHSARLLARGTARVAQKLGEEANECVVELVGGSRKGLIGESADVLYHLLVAWVSVGIRPEQVWQELHRRELASRLGEEAKRKAVVKRVIGRARVKTTKLS